MKNFTRPSVFSYLIRETTLTEIIHFSFKKAALDILKSAVLMLRWSETQACSAVLGKSLCCLGLSVCLICAI